MIHAGPSKQTPASQPAATLGHEEFIHGIRGLVCQHRHIDPETKAKILAAKLTYGAGTEGVRGQCFYEGWTHEGKPSAFVGVYATGEESVVQLAGTTVHELAHVIAGSSAGHGLAWKECCKLLGLKDAQAAGQCYIPEHFDEDLWARIVAFGQPQDGNPTFSQVGGLPFVGLPTGKAKPCPLGIGTRGGTSRGTGSGSRMRLYHCGCDPVVKVRHAGDNLQASCKVCGKDFALVNSKGQASLATVDPMTGPES